MGGPGNADGVASVARFSSPAGVATDSAGNVYVADQSNGTIRKITPDGRVTTLAGKADQSGSDDGTGGAARFRSPRGVATDSAGNVYVADHGNGAIRRISPTGVVTTLTTDVGSPSAVAVDAAGNLYVADSGFQDMTFYGNTIRKVTPAGVVTTLAGTANVTGDADGTGPAASFFHPQGIAVDGSGNVYVADTYNYKVRKVTPDGTVTTLTNAAGAKLVFDGWTYGITTDGAGNVYIQNGAAILRISPAGVVTTLAGSKTEGSADGAGAAAMFAFPAGLATDGAGYVYVADPFNNDIRKVSPAGVVTTLAGSAEVAGNVDGSGTAARFGGSRPGAPAGTAGIAVDGAGNVYVADTGNFSVRKITPGGAVTTVAAGFDDPLGVATDGAGNVFFVEGSGRIVKIAADGIVSILAGAARSLGSVDGTGSAARFRFPTGIAADSAGNLYVADSSNHSIRKITPAGVVTTLAGSPGASGNADGTGADARFTAPEGIATDSAGNVYVADAYECTIRKISPGGVVTTLAGGAGQAGAADGLGSAARFYGPRGLATDSAGNVYVADTYNHTIRMVTPSGLVTTLVGTPGTSGFADGALPGLLALPYGVAVSGSSLYITTYQGVAVLSNLP